MRKTRACLFVWIATVGAGMAWWASSSSPRVAAQGCVNPPVDLISPRRTAGATITVRIHSAFTSSERTSIIQAFEDWNANKTLNCTNVTFDTANIQILDEQPPAQPNWQWVGFDPSTEGDTAISFLNSSQFGRVYLTGRIRFCTPSFCPAFVRSVMAHELGRTFGLANKTNCAAGSTIMCSPVTSGNSITACDTTTLRTLYCPSPTPTPPPPGNECNSCLGGDEVQYCEDEGTLRIRLGAQCCTAQEQYNCILNGGTWDSVHCTCGTPIVIDVLGNGFNLTGAQDGVLFDLAADHSPRQLSWTSANSDDAWLALDRNGNGFIDNGRELFGSYTPQPFLEPDETKNGFRALAVFDRLDRGGNGDGKVDQQDAVFPNLMLWQDVNHNGISEPNELHGLVEMGFAKIDLDYRESRRLDEHGNWFRFRSKVRAYQGYQFGRWAWDVFLQAAP